MFVVVVAHDADGNIKLTKDELQKMLDDAYMKGRDDERLKGFYTFTAPSIGLGINTNATYSDSSGSVNAVHITCR